MGKKEVTMSEMVISAIKSGNPEAGVHLVDIEKHILEKYNVVGYHMFQNTSLPRKLYKREKDEIAKATKEGIKSGKLSYDKVGGYYDGGDYHGGLYKIAK